MDPLSLTASIITVIGLGGPVAEAVRGLASLRDAPNYIIALNNEMADLNLIVLAIQDIYQSQRATGASGQVDETNVDASVTSALNEANRITEKLRKLYDRLSGPGSPSRTAWLLDSRKARRIGETLRDVRLKLAAALGLLSS